MDEHDGKGGSYVRQPDGSLKLIERTQDPAPPAPGAEQDTADTAKTKANDKGGK